MEALLEKIQVNAHSSIRIESGGKVIYLDPFLITREVHDADVIFVTHDHYDHYSPEAIEKIRRSFPEAEILWRMELPCGTVDQSAQALDLSALSAEEIGEVCSVLPFMPELERINLIPENGVTGVDPEVIGMLTDAG